MLQSPTQMRPSFRWKPFAGRKQVQSLPSSSRASIGFETISRQATPARPTFVRQSSSYYDQAPLSPTTACPLTPEALGDAIKMWNFPAIVEPLSLEKAPDSPQISTEELSTRNSWNKEDALTNASNLCPVFPRRGADFRANGILPESAATSVQPPDERLQSTLNLATSLLAETLEFDFVYIMSIEISDPAHPIRIHSSHNAPIPMPYFDPHLHLRALQTPPSILVFKFSVPPGAYGAGLLVKIAVSGSRGFILGGFSEGTKITPIQRDLKYFKSFAATMEKYVPRL